MNNWKNTFADFLAKAIIVNLYLFAFGLFTSKALTSISGGLVCIFGLLRFLLLKENPLRNIDKKLNLPIFFFLSALFLSIAGRFTFKTWSEVESYLLIIIFFYVVVANLHHLKLVRNLSLISLVSMGLAAGNGLFQFYYLNFIRIKGFASYLDFGCLLAILIAFTLIYSIWGNLKPGYRIAALGSSVVLGVCLILTQTRGAWLALLGGLFCLSWIRSKKLLVFLVLICLVLTLILPQVYRDRFLSSFDIKRDPSNLGRLALWKGALLMYRDHLIRGVGLSRFQEEYETKYFQPNTDVTENPHSNLFKFIAETGTVGIVAFIWLMAQLMIWLYRNYKSVADPNWRLFLLGSLCGIIIFNIYGLTYINFGDADTLRFFWFLTALNVGVTNLADS